jgi:TolB protein
MWTPDGRRLIFTTYWNGEPHIATFDIGSGSVEVLVVDATEDMPTWNPSLSPDGRYLAFVSHHTRDRRALYIAEIGGRGSIRRLADVDAASVSWSPDGRQLAFAAPVVGSAGSSIVVDVDRPDIPRRVVSGLGTCRNRPIAA